MPVEQGRLTGMCWEGLGTPQGQWICHCPERGLRRSLDLGHPEGWERRVDSAVA